MSNPEHAGAVRKTPWLLRPPSEDAQARLFCLPYSGCGASMYRRWPRMVDGLEICPIQLPGRENRMREAPYATYEQLAADLTEALLPYLDRPFGLFGHCGSALIAYETAVQLERGGAATPAGVFVSSQVAPHEGPYGTYLTMDDVQLAAELESLIRQMGGTPTPDLVQLCLGVMRADVDANALYKMAQPARLRGPLVAIGWDSDTNVRHELMGGWAQYSAAADAVILPGAHFEFLRFPASLQATFLAYLGLAAAQPSWRVSVDADICVGSGTCVSVAPDRFVFDDEDRSRPRHSVITELGVVELAAQMCPTAAIRLSALAGRAK
ncbi:thioesterase domain-containing protein [Dactylosporangium sp. NPDC051484]|uniref:thioesterase domain-containing protein n=1 Tax=Dactylosporangium sp. NPDC051484 TaxID=3154942 RepID=UPI00344BEAEC